MRLVEGWNELWGAFASGPITAWLSIIGAIIIVIAILQYVWRRKSGQGAHLSSLLWPLLIGGILAGPGIIIPALLSIIQGLIMAVVAVIQMFSSKAGTP